MTLFESHNNDVDDEAIVMWWLVLLINGVSFVLCMLDVFEARSRSNTPRRFGLCVAVLACCRSKPCDKADKAQSVNGRLDPTSDTSNLDVSDLMF